MPLKGIAQGPLCERLEGRRLFSQTLVSNTTISGRIDENPADAYQVDVEAGERLFFSVGQGSNPDPLFDPRIRLYGPGGNLLASDAGGLGAYIEHAAASTGTFTLLVEAVGAQIHGDYRLYFLRLPHAGTPTDPADGHGAHLLPGVMVERARITTYGDVDLYTLTADVGDRVTLTLTEHTPSSSLFDPRITLYAPGGAVVANVEAAGTTPGVIDEVVAAAGTYYVVVRDGGLNVDGTGYYQLDFTAATLDDAPRVTDVFVSSTRWSASYRQRLVAAGMADAAFGVRIDPAAQSRTLPWSNLNRVSVRFSEDVIVHDNDLHVSGVNLAEHGLTGDGFSYDPATFTATWTLEQSVAADKITLRVDGSAATGVTSASTGQTLDGDWLNPDPATLTHDTFPSGDGTAGGDFLFSLRVLPGDVDRDGVGDIHDLNDVKFHFGQSAAASLLADIDGDDVISIVDLNVVKANFGKGAPQ